MTQTINDWCAQVAANESVGPPETYIFTDDAALIDFFNGETAIIHTGDHVRIATFDKAGRPQFLRLADATLLYKPYKFEWEVDGDTKWKDAIKVWLDSPMRRQYRAVVFKPQGAEPDELNLFTGLAVTPAEGGSWALLKAHILDNICQGNQLYSAWLIAWMAQIIQEPASKPGTAVALKGEMGTGKSVISDVLGVLIGDRHAPALDQSDQLTGRFNGHLEEVLLARVEEGFFAGDPKARSSLKHLITSRTLQYERKNLNAYTAANYTRVILTTNEDWAVPAGMEERRWFVLNVGNAKRQDRAYFGAIIAELEAGGYEAMMFDLQRQDISKVDLRNPPRTKALVEQIVQGLSPENAWWLQVLENGGFHTEDSLDPLVEWNGDGPLDIEKSSVAQSFREHVHGYRGRTITDQQIGAFLAKTVPGLRTTRPSWGGRKRHYVFPPLADLRKAFSKATGYIFESEEQDEWFALKVVGGTEVQAKRVSRPRRF